MTLESITKSFSASIPNVIQITSAGEPNAQFSDWEYFLLDRDHANAI
jgi:hypothetical protein